MKKYSFAISVLSMIAIFCVIVGFNSRKTVIVSEPVTVFLFDNQVPYSWNGVKYSESGVYADTLETRDGADSVATLKLTVSKNEYNSYPVYFTHSGQMQGNTVRIYADTVSPTSATYSIDISAVGYTGVLSCNVVASNNTSSIGSMPIAVIKTVSPTAIVVNILQSNTSLVSILGLNVLQGAGLQLASSVSGVVLYVNTTGY